jgi:photosystem II stability/assembly factor-like uncharacterized protein
MATIDGSRLKALEWRLIGPHRGGRVVAVAGHPTEPMVFYFGAASGGVWKTEDGGVYWENVSDGFFNTAAVGAIAVAESDPNVIYVGTGESCIRGNVSHGDGVYKSTDGGRSWAHLGLEDTRHIGRIRIHPRNADVVYVAALGHAFGPNRERGVYRSKDGGKNWEQVLFRSEKAGAVDLSMDPNNPRIIYAAVFEARRYPWTMTSGGPDSSLYRSTDGGDTWEELTDNPGLPSGVKGRIGVAVSPAKAGRVWAIVESEDGGLFRSDDGGATWQKVTDDPDLRARPYYYCHVYADPQDPETVYMLTQLAYKSTDGGRTLRLMPTPHGDNHDLWLDPRNPQRMIEGNDGGAFVSFNGGASWSSGYNQPTAQFYHVATDERHPYRVYGAQQDNSTISLPSRSREGAITQDEWCEHGGGESGYIAVRPDDPNIVFAGGQPHGVLTRFDYRTGQKRQIMPWPEFHWGCGVEDMKHRFGWTFPVVISPHDPNVWYVAGNQVFRSTNEGSSWEIISPDLTRNDVTKMGRSGGPVTKDNTSVEYYCTIFAFAESPCQRGTFWVGSDDGLIHVSRDGGQTWEDVTPHQLPEWTLISIIEASPHDPATAYIAATQYKLDDVQPYLFKTNDYGKTWEKITNGMPEDDFTRVIREDPDRRGLLYAGTETGVYFSFDDGASWQSLQLNLPVVPIHDLVVKDSDLVVATHGRSFWILDDMSPLRQITDQLLQASVHLFKPEPAYRFLAGGSFPGATQPNVFPTPSTGINYQRIGFTVVAYRKTRGPDGQGTLNFLDAGRNPPDGVMITYYLKDKPEGEVALTLLDPKGQVIRRFSSQPPDQECQRVPAEAGINRFAWDMSYPEARRAAGDDFTRSRVPGPLAAPGHYQIQLTVGNETHTDSFEIRKSPHVLATQGDLEAQFDLQMRIRDKTSEVNDAIDQIRSIKGQAKDWVGRTDSDSVAQAANNVTEKLLAIEEELIQVGILARWDVTQYPVKLNTKLATLGDLLARADAAPTQQMYGVFDDLSSRADRNLGRLKEVIETDVAAFNRMIREFEVPAIASAT